METKNWQAWVSTWPIFPQMLNVTGDIKVANPGIKAELYEREADIQNPSTLSLDLHLIQRDGAWPQVLTWVQSNFSKYLGPDCPEYTEVKVFFENNLISEMKVSRPKATANID